MGIVGYQNTSVILFSQEKSNEIRGKSNEFIWIWDSYCLFFLSLAKVMNGFVK